MKSSPFVVMLLAGGLVAAPPCRATNHLIQLNEVMAGCGGDARIQFVEVVFPQMQNRWGGCAELAFFDATGAQTASFPFPSDVPDDHRDGNSALIATQAFADLPGAPHPDFLIPPVIQAPGGKVCFRGNQPEPCFPVDICPGWLRITMSTVIPVGIAVTVPAKAIAGLVDPASVAAVMAAVDPS